MALRLRGATSGYIELKAPASAGDNTLTLPTNNGGANQLLIIDGSGNLSWQSSLTFDAGLLKIDDLSGTAGKGRLEFGNSGEQFIEGYDTGNAGSGSYLTFGDGSTVRLRIKSGGEVRIGDNSTTASTAGDDLVIEGSSDRGLSIISGTSSSGNIYFGDTDDADIGRIAYQHNDNAIDFSVNAASTRLRIHSSGITVYGNDNYFYGGGGGTNLNGDIKIRSTGTAVYQSLKFMSSDGSSQSQILGYGGGAILFFYANEFVWGINNQGERLNLTNTALTPRTNSTVLDLGTTGNRYRRTYTDGITVNTSNTNTKFCISGGSSANVMTIRNTTLGNGYVGMLFSTQDHSGGREKAAIYHHETHGQAHYGGDFIFCLANSTGGAAQVAPSDEKMRIRRSGEVYINTGSSVDGNTSQGLHVNSASGSSCISMKRGDSGHMVRFINVSTLAGYINSPNTSTMQYQSSSDYRLKENNVAITDGITKVKQLKPIRFNWKEGSDTTTTFDGFLAHEIQAVVPQAASGVKDATNEDGSVKAQATSLTDLVPILTAALQEAIAKIETLEAEVAVLKGS